MAAVLPSESPGAKICLPAQAHLRLVELGLAMEPLTESISDGASAFRSVTPFHPVSYAGQRMWAETTASLGRALGPHGWEPESLNNVAMVVHRKFGRAIIVTAGSHGVGNERYSPQVRYEREEVIQRLVNGELDSLFSPERPPKWEVWFLLHDVSIHRHDAELARPQGISGSGLVTTWIERILLPTTSDGEIVGPTNVTPPEIAINVQRRQTSR